MKINLKNLPPASGVYLFKDERGRVIYIGKAVNIRKRVGSYFGTLGQSPKTDVLIKHIADIETIQTSSEAEALILEASLIKRHQPKYNVALKDSKTYPFIQIAEAKFPTISLVRPKNKNVKAQLYGPYVNPPLIREALKIIRKIFPYCTCRPKEGRRCLYCDLGLCPAPYDGKISQQEYARHISRIKLILEGRKDELYRQLYEEMQERSRQRDFEGALRLREKLRAVGALYSSTRDINYFKESEQLQRALRLKRPVTRIECFDISNIMGQQAVGSMVSFLNGKPDKNNYRRFRVKSVEGIDDTKMVAEVIRRRYSRLQQEGASFPDLVVVDGGKGQLSAAVKELERLKISLPIVALAKSKEEVFMPGRRLPVELAQDSLGLRLLMRVRDEAHRFGLKYHTLLRKKNFLGNASST